MKKKVTTSVEVKDSQMYFTIILLIAFISTILIVFGVVWISGVNIDIYVLIVLFTLTSFLFLFPICISGIGSRKVIINENGIEFYIKDYLIFGYYWSELEQINLYREMVHYPHSGLSMERIDLEYVIQFFGSKIDKTIRLWYFPFRVKNQELIVQSIKRFAGAINTLKIIELPDDNDTKYCDRNYKRMHNLLDDMLLIRPFDKNSTFQ